MTNLELVEEISIEASLMRSVLQDLSDLLAATAGREPTAVEKAATGAFLGQLYGGMENILKRFCRFHGSPLPEGLQWHRDLVVAFCYPPSGALPALFDEARRQEMDEYRRFRHFFVHGYSLLIDWARLLPLAESAEGAFGTFLSIALRAAKEL